MDPPDRRSLLLGLLGMAGTAALAACSDDAPGRPAPGRPSTSPPGPSPSAPSPLPPRWPLSGRPVDDVTRTRRPAVAVKVPDNRNEHPQTGLDQADIVFVELDGYRDAAGYGGTRLVPVFHSHLPDDVAPVRSMRPVDVPLLSPADAIIGSTGAAGWVRDYVAHYRRHVEGGSTYLATRGTGAYSIDRSRVRTYQGATYYDRAVVCHPRVLAGRSPRFRNGPPRPYFPFAETEGEVSTVTGRPARTVRVPWKRAHTYDMSYRFDERSGRYRRSLPWGPHELSDGTRVAPDNVLVVRARQHYAKIYRGSGHEEPIHDIVQAGGTFVYVHAGRYVDGTWRKAAPEQPFTFTLTDGRPLLMAPGQTYVELANRDADVRVD
jgi:Protein of unknown function (DUF3048) N-terminal domain/Protein of unknown function (DUF3048) C-terminal domain